MRAANSEDFFTRNRSSERTATARSGSSVKHFAHFELDANAFSDPKSKGKDKESGGNGNSIAKKGKMAS